MNKVVEKRKKGANGKEVKKLSPLFFFVYDDGKLTIELIIARQMNRATL